MLYVVVHTNPKSRVFFISAPEVTFASLDYGAHNVYHLSRLDESLKVRCMQGSKEVCRILDKDPAVDR